MLEEISADTSKETRLFSLVCGYLNGMRHLSDEYKIKLSHKICQKLKSYKHNEKNNDFLTMYIQYYISGYLDRFDFDKIISDGVFHILEYEPSKNFFIEVYFGNYYLINKFQEETSEYAFSNPSTKTNYLNWLEDNFKVCYNKYHKNS